MAEILDNGWKYADIIKDTLTLVPDNVDKREGSIMFNTLAPTSYMLSRQNYMLGYLAQLLFADTATGEWLDRVTNDFGINRKLATQAIRQIRTYDTKGNPYNIPTGVRFAIEDVSFQTTERQDVGLYKAVCEQYGTKGNFPRKELLPVDNIGGSFGYAELVSDVLIPARDDETDDQLRERFYLYVRSKPYGGNKSDYKLKVMDISGVGNVKIFGAPVMGPGAVGIIVTDTQGRPATEELLERVRKLVAMEGDGIAPIGHHPQVKTSTDRPINVTAALKLRDGVQFELVKPKVQETVAVYINSIDFELDDTIYYSKVIAAILDADLGIRDATDVTVDGVTTNVSLTRTWAQYEVPVLGELTLTEAVKPDA